MSGSSPGNTEAPVCALCLQLTSHLMRVSPAMPVRSSSTIRSRRPSAPRSGPTIVRKPISSRNSRANNSKRSRAAPAAAVGISLKSNMGTIFLHSAAAVQTRNRAFPYTVAARKLGEGCALRSAAAGFGLLCCCQFRRTAHVLAALFRPAAAFGGAGADKVALHVSEPAENGNHQSPGAGAGIGPRFREGTKVRLGVHDLFDYGEQVKGAAGEAVNPRHRHHIAGGETFQHVEKLAAVGARTRHLLAVNLGASSAA